MIKDIVLSLLEENRGEPVSGEEIAEKLKVTRSAVNKAVRSLRDDGYNISARTKHGYCLEKDDDKLSVIGIKKYLDEKFSDNYITVLDTVDSTNTYAKKLANEGVPHASIIVANEQTKGRGRLGRTFYSPADKGVYISFVLRPKMQLSEASFLTVVAGVAACQAIEKTTDLTPSIKWVNDVFVRGKKCCGILSEATSDFETMSVQNVVVGIGINVSNDVFPDEIKNTAVSLGGVLRNKLAAEVINCFLSLADSFSREEIVKEYKKKCFVIGKEITYTLNGTEYKAKVIDINNDANLVVQNDDGTVSVLKSGEISIGSSNLTK